MSHLASFDHIILFFVLGLFASWIKSDLSIPDSVSKFLSIFLLLCLGLKGGHEVRFAASLEGLFLVLGVGGLSCFLIPTILFFTLRARLGYANASALAASFGSVSAVTFVAAQGILENEGIVFNGYMVAIMALMEIPAILVAIYYFQKYSSEENFTNRSLIKSIFSAKSVVLLLGGFAIGLAMNQKSWLGISPVVQDGFKGVLAFFLLDLGLVAQKQLREAWTYKSVAFPVALLLPLVFGSAALLVVTGLGASRGDSILLAVLVGSASYIAAPAAIRASVPQANPSLYMALPLGLTFPMNLIFGIPLYIKLESIINT